MIYECECVCGGLESLVTSLRKFSKSSSYVSDLSRFLPPLRGDDKLKSEIDIFISEWLNLFVSSVASR